MSKRSKRSATAPHDAGDVPALAPHEPHQRRADRALLGGGVLGELPQRSGERPARHSRCRPGVRDQLDVEQQVDGQLGAAASGEVERVVGEADAGEAAGARRPVLARRPARLTSSVSGLSRQSMRAPVSSMTNATRSISAPRCSASSRRIRARAAASGGAGARRPSSDRAALATATGRSGRWQWADQARHLCAAGAATDACQAVLRSGAGALGRLPPVGAARRPRPPGGAVRSPWAAVSRCTTRLDRPPRCCAARAAAVELGTWTAAGAGRAGATPGSGRGRAFGRRRIGRGRPSCRRRAARRDGHRRVAPTSPGEAGSRPPVAARGALRVWPCASRGERRHDSVADRERDRPPGARHTGPTWRW